MVCFVECILIRCKFDDEYLQNLREVCERLQKCGIRVEHSNCRFLQPSVEYLFHIVDSIGFMQSQVKLELS